MTERSPTVSEPAANGSVDLSPPPGGPRALSLAAPEGASPSRLGVLRHRHYRNVWLGALASNVGGWMEIVGVQWIVAKTTGSALLMGVLAAAQLGPTLVLGLPGGLVADRMDRKRLLLVTQSAMMLVATSLAAAAFGGWATPGVLIGLSLLHGIAVAFNTPAWQVLTPRLVPREELTEAIALNGLQFNLARVVGPALGGVLMVRFGAGTLFTINALSFLGVIVTVAATPRPSPPAREARSAWQQTREALAFVFHGRGPWAVFLGMVVFATLAAPLMRMLPLFVSEVYGASEATYGSLLAIMGAGAVAGVMVLRRIPRWYPKHHFIPLSIAASGVSIVAFSAATGVLTAAAALFAAGIFWLWAFNSSFAAMQLLVEDRMRGRVLAICNTAVFGAMPLGSVLAGVVGDFVAGHADTGVGVQVGVGLFGLVLTIAGLAMLIWRTPEVDGIAPGEPGHERVPGLVAGLTARVHRPREAAGAPPATRRSGPAARGAS